MKNCIVCKESLPHSEFHKDSRSKDGVRDKCKTCVKEYNKIKFLESKKICLTCSKNKSKDSFNKNSVVCKKCVLEESYLKSENIICKVCFLEKEKSNFSRNINSKLGVQKICKSCKKEKLNTPEKKLKNNKRQNEYNKKRFFYARATFILNRSKKLNIPIEYEVRDLTTLLARKWKEQKGFCKLTNIRLNKSNSQVDHIIPVSKGGTSNISNLRWTLKDVNRMKGDLEDSLFYELCLKICENKY
jgi:hypothetical protein